MARRSERGGASRHVSEASHGGGTHRAAVVKQGRPWPGRDGETERGKRDETGSEQAQIAAAVARPVWNGCRSRVEVKSKLRWFRQRSINAYLRIPPLVQT
ncbi:hypothetical protein ZWY2020_032895 [Hordeum vulgare]|nr:hypothetical protein ZWY2020_032895 [Hordeum vulgare]